MATSPSKRRTARATPTREAGHRQPCRRADLAGHLRAASGVPHDGQAPRRERLRRARREPVLSRQKAPTRRQGAATPIPSLLPLAQRSNATTHATDAKAFIAWLDQQPSVAKNRKIGTQGYCMGGPMAFRTAATSDRVGAVASFHGGGLVTDDADSPLCHGVEDQGVVPRRDRRQRRHARPMEKDVLKDTF
jgi:dienelactone hydrolase